MLTLADLRQHFIDDSHRGDRLQPASHVSSGRSASRAITPENGNLITVLSSHFDNITIFDSRLLGVGLY